MADSSALLNSLILIGLENANRFFPLALQITPRIAIGINSPRAIFILIKFKLVHSWQAPKSLLKLLFFFHKIGKPPNQTQYQQSRLSNSFLKLANFPTLNFFTVMMSLTGFSAMSEILSFLSSLMVHRMAYGCNP